VNGVADLFRMMKQMTAWKHLQRAANANATIFIYNHCPAEAAQIFRRWVFW
jgi:hypothetical protein